MALDTSPDVRGCRLSAERLEPERGRLAMPGPAVILEFAEPFPATLWRSSLLDVFLQVEAEEL